MVAIEGAHGSGKTTLVHALASQLKERHVHLGVQGDVARRSPLVEEVVVHERGQIDLSLELHILASQLAGEQELARHHQLVLCDKSVLSVIAYARLFLTEGLDGSGRSLLESMARMAHSYAIRYDAIFLLGDLYALRRTADPYRPDDGALREKAAELIAVECEAAGTVHEVPLGLATAEKVEWVLSQLGEIDE